MALRSYPSILTNLSGVVQNGEIGGHPFPSPPRPSFHLYTLVNAKVQDGTGGPACFPFRFDADPRTCSGEHRSPYEESSLSAWKQCYLYINHLVFFLSFPLSSSLLIWHSSAKAVLPFLAGYLEHYRSPRFQFFPVCQLPFPFQTVFP